MTDELNVYDFEDESYDDLKNKTIDDIDGEETKKSLQHFSASVIELIKTKQVSKHNKKGFVFLVSGGWGAGKSTATWAMYNSVKDNVAANDKSKNPCLVFEKSLLPFGNATESISTFLGNLSEELWSEGIVDIRTEIRQFILEVTPEAEANYNLGASIGPFNLSKAISKTPTGVDTATLVSKFNRLIKLNKSLFIILDDIDRLRPSEIVDVMRMVEKLRALPRVIIILPVYKVIITTAFQEELKLEPSSAATFLRKLSDGEVFIYNDLDDLRTSFIKAFEDKKTEYENRVTDYEMSIGELCWYVLLHNLILKEAIADVRSGDVNGTSITRLFDGTLSQYIREFRETLYRSAEKDSSSPYPVHNMQGDNPIFQSLGDYYGDIKDNSDANRTLDRLSTLLQVDDLIKAVTTKSDIVSSVASRQPTTFSEEAQAESSSSIFDIVLLPLLKKAEKEPLLTNNYKRRDMKILARMIKGDVDFKPDKDIFRTVYNVISKNYDRFRF